MIENENKYIYIIGIGGVGMSAIANVFNDLGYIVSGSDKNSTIYTDMLPKTIKVYYKYNIKNIINIDKSSIIVSSDINDHTNVELDYCIKNNLNLVSRYDIIQYLSNNKISIGITGSHGKSTTSTLCAHMLDSSFMLGAISKNYNINGRYNKSSESKYFVYELDESNKLFSNVKANNIIVTNITNEHIELYESEQDLQYNINKIESNTPNLIYCGDHIFDNKNLVLKYNLGISYGFEPTNKYIIMNYNQYEMNSISFDIVGENIKYSNIKINLLGRHNALNTCAVFLMGLSLGLKPDEIKNKFESFKGAKYRLDLVGYQSIDNYRINFYYDNGTHPTELKSILSTIPSNYNVLIIWHPHKNERLKNTFDQWINIFNNYKLIVTELMQPKPIKSTEKLYLNDLFDKLNCKNKSLIKLSDLDTAIFKNINSSYIDIVISVGLRFDVFKSINLKI